MFCVVDVPLRIQIPVTDFDGMVETVIAHGAIIVGQASDQLVRKDGVACCFPAPLKKEERRPPAQRSHGENLIVL
jgi:hypothetical protein